jgi:phosphoribosyl-AMP cyclohydrolase
MYAMRRVGLPPRGARHYIGVMTSGSSMQFSTPPSKAELEEGAIFRPRFDENGLIVCVTTDAHTGAVLMVAYMNVEALRLTVETGTAHYWSRSRKALWRKGDTSGQVQTVTEIRTDCDQDAMLLKVVLAGDGNSCHTGRKSCFYRRVSTDTGELVFDAY